MTFVNEWTVKAIRKVGRCSGCMTMVEVGESAVRWAGMTDGDFGTALYHPECREAELALNRMHGTYHDEWEGLSDIDPEDHEWLRAEHPIVAERMGLAALEDPSHAD